MPESKTKPAVFLEDVQDKGRVLSRQRHLELLVFEILTMMESEGIIDEDALQSDNYESVRVLYKALAHGRRPNGSTY